MYHNPFLSKMAGLYQRPYKGPVISKAALNHHEKQRELQKRHYTLFTQTMAKTRNHALQGDFKGMHKNYQDYVNNSVNLVKQSVSHYMDYAQQQHPAAHNYANSYAHIARKSFENIVSKVKKAKSPSHRATPAKKTYASASMSPMGTLVPFPLTNIAHPGNLGSSSKVSHSAEPKTVTKRKVAPKTTSLGAKPLAKKPTRKATTMTRFNTVTKAVATPSKTTKTAPKKASSISKAKTGVKKNVSSLTTAKKKVSPISKARTAAKKNVSSFSTAKKKVSPISKARTAAKKNVSSLTAAKKKVSPVSKARTAAKKSVSPLNTTKKLISKATKVVKKAVSSLTHHTPKKATSASKAKTAAKKNVSSLTTAKKKVSPVSKARTAAKKNVSSFSTAKKKVSPVSKARTAAKKNVSSLSNNKTYKVTRSATANKGVSGTKTSKVAKFSVKTKSNQGSRNQFKAKSH